MDILIKSGGGTGPMIPGNSQHRLEMCQILQHLLKDKKVLFVMI